MATPILKIPVDDAAFQRYLSSFQKYQKQLDEQPEMWRGINDSIKDNIVASAAMAEEIGRQAAETAKLAEEEEKREAALREAAKEREREAKEAEKREQRAIQRRQQAINQVKEYARNLADTAISLGKWAVMGGATGMIGSALGMWGLDRMAEGVAGQYRTAKGMGVSMGQAQGANLTMQRYFDVNSTMENIANMQQNPSQWGVFRMMGINPQGKSASELTYESAAAARRMFIGDKGNLALAQAQGLTQIFSPDDLRRMAAEKPGEFNRMQREGRQYQGMSDEVGRKWQNFSFVMDKVKLSFENKLLGSLSKLEGPLSKVVEKFGDLAVSVLNRIDWDVLGKGIDKFADYLGSPAFQEDFKTFIDSVSAIARKIVEALRLLGWIPEGGSTPGNDTQGVNGGPGARRQVASMGPAGKIIDMSPAKNLATDMFRKWGWQDHHIKGIISNIQAESAFNPFAVGDSGKAYGLGQWHEDRQAEYAKWAGHTMQSVRDPRQALVEQLKFIQWELNNKEGLAKKKLQATTNAYSAGKAVSDYYERPKDDWGLVGAARGANAALITLKVENKTGASVTTTANSAAGGK